MTSSPPAPSSAARSCRAGTSTPCYDAARRELEHAPAGHHGQAVDAAAVTYEALSEMQFPVRRPSWWRARCAEPLHHPSPAVPLIEADVRRLACAPLPGVEIRDRRDDPRPRRRPGRHHRRSRPAAARRQRRGGPRRRPRAGGRRARGGALRPGWRRSATGARGSYRVAIDLAVREPADPDPAGCAVADQPALIVARPDCRDAALSTQEHGAGRSRSPATRPPTADRRGRLPGLPGQRRPAGRRHRIGDADLSAISSPWVPGESAAPPRRLPRSPGRF